MPGAPIGVHKSLATCALLSPPSPSHNTAPMSGEAEAVDMNAALFAAKQQLRSAMKQRLAALPLDAVKEQSTFSSARPHIDFGGMPGALQVLSRV